MPKVLIFFQTNYLENLDGAAYRVTSQRREIIGFYCNDEEADSKIFAYIKFLYDNIWWLIFASDVTVISLYQSATNFAFLDLSWYKTGTGDDISLYMH